MKLIDVDVGEQEAGLLLLLPLGIICRLLRWLGFIK
jgi:hypothetical protein